MLCVRVLDAAIDPNAALPPMAHWWNNGAPFTPHYVNELQGPDFGRQVPNRQTQAWL